jgi:hypothetical protein
MSRLDIFRSNLMLALKYSRGYVWLYGEQCRWFPAKMQGNWEKVVLKTPGKGRLWEEAMPGITASVEFAKNPEATVAKLLKENKLKEIFHIDFEAKADENNKQTDGKALQTLKEVFIWQSPTYKPKGTVERDITVGCESKSSAKLTGVQFGCISKVIPVKPGQVYYATAAAKCEGTDKPGFSVSWQTADKCWAEQYMVKSIFTKELKDGWKSAAVIVTVPADIHYMGVMCGTPAPVGTENIYWFDDITVYRVF